MPETGFKSPGAVEIPDTTVRTPAPAYDVPGLIDVAGLDEWGVSRRVGRVFAATGNFDFTALPYADRTAIFVRNRDRSNGLAITYGAGGATELQVTNESGLYSSVTGRDDLTIDGGAFVVMERDGAVVRASITAGERVRYFADYTSANAAGPLPHDVVVLIRATGEAFGRITSTAVDFPVSGQPDADWFKVGAAEKTYIAKMVNDSTTYNLDTELPDPGQREFVTLKFDGGKQVEGDITFLSPASAATTFQVWDADGTVTAYPAGSTFTRTGKRWTAFRSEDGTVVRLIEQGGADGVVQKAVFGSYTYNSSGENGFAWTQEEAENVTGAITNSGTAGHVLSGGLFKVSYTAQKQTNAGGAAVNYLVNGVTKYTAISTTANSGAAMVDIVDASASDQTVRFLRSGSFGQGNTNAQLVIEKIRDNIQYVEKADLVEVEDAEVTLIDVDATNGTLYTFSTGETWADIKANYERLIVTGNASRSGVNQIRPWSCIIDLGDQTNGFTQSGFRMDFTNDYSVTVYADAPQDAHTGLTYRQSGGDAPTSGRMQFTVVGVKKRRTVVDPANVEVDTATLVDGDTLVWDAATNKLVKGVSGGNITTQYTFTSANTASNQAKTLTGSSAIKAAGYVPVSYQVHVVSGTGYLASDQVGAANSAWVANTALTNATGTGNLGVNFYATGSSVRGKQILITVIWGKVDSVVSV